LRWYKRISHAPPPASNPFKKVCWCGEGVENQKYIFPYGLRLKPVNGLPYCDGGWLDDDDLW